MELGTLLPTAATEPDVLDPESIVEFGRTAEDLGFNSLWTLDHIALTPFHSTTFLDPVVALSHLAARTDTIGLGTSILILPLRRTVNVASRAASLQHLSDGRLTLGFGAGYVEKEFEATGVPLEERGPRLSEAMGVLWQLFDGSTSFSGRFHEFEDLAIEPTVDTRPPLLAGGGAATTAEGDETFPEPILERIANADGWIAAPTSVAKAERDVGLIEDYCRDHPSAEPGVRKVMLNYTYITEGTESEVRREQERAWNDYFGREREFADGASNCLVGTVQEIREQLRAYEDLGFDEVIAAPLAHEPAELHAQLDRIHAEIMEPR